MSKSKKGNRAIFKFLLVLFIFFSPFFMNTIKSQAYEESNPYAISTEEKEILEAYLSGTKNLPEQVVARKAKAEELGLLEEVDSDYFLRQSFFEGKSDGELEEMGVHILVNPLTEEELDAWLNMYQSGISLYTVTYYERVSSGDTMVGKFEVDGKLAICLEHYVNTPAKNSSTGTPTLITNENIRKILYYGYGGPGASIIQSTYGRNMNTAAGLCATSCAASYYYTGSRLYYDEFSAGGTFKDWVAKLPNTPSNFKVYKVTTNGGSTQDLAYFELEELNGELMLEKSSANTAITSNNNCYSLENAIYGVYSNSNCTTKVGELKTNASGKTNTLSLTAGTYYIKEITAPKNYKLDTTVYSVTVKSSTLTTKNVTDEPLSDPVRLLLGKVDKDTNSNKPNGSKSLQNAQFTFKFYLGDYAENVNPTTLGKTPTKTWVIKTDEDGYCRLGDSFKVSGDSFWYNANNEPTLPLGTLTVQETKAPEGYHINPEIFVIKIKPNSTTGVVTYNMPVVKEQAVQFTIYKVQEGTSTVISSVKFAHTDPKGTVTNYTTNAQGKIVLDGLSVGTHSIKEVSTVEGYELNLSEFKFKINADGSVTSLSDVGNLFTIDVNGNGVLKVENKVRPYSLKITKVNNYGVTLEGATFGLFSDKNCQNLVAKKQTSSTGELVFEGLRTDTTYYLKELEAPDGYRLDDVIHVYEVSASSNPTKNEFFYYVDKTKYSISNTSGPIHLEGTKDNRIISIEVVNQIGMQLPQTGSSQMVWLYTVTLGAFLISNYYRKKENI